MNLFYKRVLIFFSVALNIGFIIVAAISVYHHSCRPPRKHSIADFVAMVEDLNLGETEKEDVITEITRFKKIMDNHDLELKKARRSVLAYLAEPGDLDTDHLQKLIDAVDTQERTKRDLFRTHAIQMRMKLGPEKGPLFFSELLTSKKHKYHKEPSENR